MKKPNPSIEKKPMDVPMERILNQAQLASLLNIKVGTLYSHLSRGIDLPPFFKVNSQTRWRESVVWKWIEQKEMERKRRNFE
jgi:predicted DNA-binding transcriptional regulator AlpA